MACTSGTRAEHDCRMPKKARLLTRPTLAATSLARPESAKTASSPRDAPCPGKAAASQLTLVSRFTPHASRFSILLVRWREHRNDVKRASGPTGNFHLQGDHVES